MLRGLSRTGVARTHEQLSAEDVTEAYVDTQVRVENQEKAVAQLQKLMERAEKVQDVLSVQRELSRATAELESLKGRLARLKHRVGMSTITVTFELRGRQAQPPPRPDDSLWGRIKRAVGEVVQGIAHGASAALVAAVVGAILCVPLAAVVLLAVALWKLCGRRLWAHAASSVRGVGGGVATGAVAQEGEEERLRSHA